MSISHRKRSARKRNKEELIPELECRKKKKNYHGILQSVDKSGISLISPTAVRLVPSAGPSQNELIAIEH